MNIEEEIKILRNYIERSPFNTSLKPQELGLSEAIETLLTAYEKEKEKNNEARERIICLLDRFDLEEELQDEYDTLMGSSAVVKILKLLLKEE